MRDKATPIGEDGEAGAAALLEEQIRSRHPGMDEALRHSLARLGASIAARDAQEARAQPARAVRLPVWPEATRGVPNSFLRGALFAAIQGKERRYLSAELLASRDGISIRFTGMQLDQSDLDLWEQAVQSTHQHPLGKTYGLSIHGFLVALGRNTGKKDHEWLKGSLRRLASTCVEITHGRYTYGGSMLEFAYDDSAGIYTLRLNPKIISLYEAGWTAIDWNTRQKLRRKPLALWLHGYLSSDAENYPTKLETLRRLSGSNTKALKHFKANLKTALADLESATEGRMTGTITETSLVEWKRQPTPSQERHLAKKAVRPGTRLNKPSAVNSLLPNRPCGRKTKEPTQ